MKFSNKGLSEFYERSSDKSSFGEPVPSVVQLPDILPSGSEVLDLGAGDGRNSLFLASKGMNVKAIDLSEAGISKLKRLAAESGVNVETEVADVVNYSIEHDYDALVVILLFQFLKENEVMRLMNEMKAHTKPGGVNVVHMFTSSGDRQNLDRIEDPDSECFYPEDGWLKEFYGDWEIIDHSSASSTLIGKFKEDGTPMMSTVERIVAKKDGGFAQRYKEILAKTE